MHDVIVNHFYIVHVINIIYLTCCNPKFQFGMCIVIHVVYEYEYIFTACKKDVFTKGDSKPVVADSSDVY